MTQIRENFPWGYHVSDPANTYAVSKASRPLGNSITLAWFFKRHHFSTFPLVNTRTKRFSPNFSYLIITLLKTQETKTVVFIIVYHTTPEKHKKGLIIPSSRSRGFENYIGNAAADDSLIDNYKIMVIEF